jgi:hypothetical protein
MLGGREYVPDERFVVPIRAEMPKVTGDERRE